MSKPTVLRGAVVIFLAVLLALATSAQVRPKARPAPPAPPAPATTAPPMPPAPVSAVKPPEQVVRPPRMNIQKHTLTNGLQVLMVEDHSSPVVSLHVWYHVGSKDERAGRTGFAHLFEHLMFKGSAHVAPDEHSRLVEAVGGSDNAGTFFDYTFYFQTFPSNYLERVIWLEADRLGSLNVDEANFTSEREVVKEERRFRYENAPYGLLAEDLYATAFTAHPYKHLPIGSMEDLNKASVADVREFFRTYYRPDNATMIIAGDFRAAQAIQWVEKYFAGIPKPAAPIPRIGVAEPAQTAERRVTKSYGSNSPLPAVAAGYKMPGIYTPDYYPLVLAANILAEGESSRLYRRLVYDEGIAVQAGGFPLFTEQPNLFWVYAIMNQGRTTADGEKSLFDVLEKMKTEPLDPKELEKAKNQVISGLIMGRRTVQQKANALGQIVTLTRDPELINTELDHILAVTPADIQRVARTYFDPKRRTVLIITPPAGSGEGGKE